MSSQNWGFLTPSPPLSRLFTKQNWQFLTLPPPPLGRHSLWTAPKHVFSTDWHFLTPLPPICDYVINEWSLRSFPKIQAKFSCR